jgi:hypothetical protein
VARAGALDRLTEEMAAQARLEARLAEEQAAREDAEGRLLKEAAAREALESRLTEAIRVKADAVELVTFHSALPLKAGLDDLKVRSPSMLAKGLRPATVGN